MDPNRKYHYRLQVINLQNRLANSVNPVYNGLGGFKTEKPRLIEKVFQELKGVEKCQTSNQLTTTSKVK